MSDLISRADAIDAVERIGSLDTDADREYARSIIDALPSAEAETVLCALADRTCPFQGNEFAWCLTCPHISEEDRELVKRVVPEQKTVEWIPCSERLPSVDGDAYLVTDYCPQINRRRIHIAYCYANKDGFWSDTPIGYKVVAWKPLPKPYREDGELNV